MARSISDETLSQRPETIGPVEVRFTGNWDRVEQSLSSLEHDVVRYRWKQDSAGELGLFIEIPVHGNIDENELLAARDRLRDAFDDLDGDRPVYFHFVSAETVETSLA